ncbi:MAG TPA: prenyltransferase/squalene oxidase repeat-containing protein [Solirubrobacterales bacterium]|nr:prenyltransferase/squalene oxidase repeat-containing protein [Solirubrobacterales bacterium]
MSWELASFVILGALLIGGFAWYERSRPTSQVVALVAALAALAIAGRIAFAAFPNVKPTTDIVIFAGFAFGPAPGFAVGGLAALVSNFWFGQGPWTPWQMAGWGMCGILGAGLAVVRPRAGRFTLAVVCAAAAVVYGALLNFSLMATYGGDLSWRYFLTLEARAVPFEAAHAIGNATLALLAGPAMVRMLIRFRERFEWRSPAVASTLLLALALLSVLPAHAGAAGIGPTRAAVWLASEQNADGGWGASPGEDSSPEVTAWAMLGLEAIGRSPLDVTHEGHSPVDYLRGRVEQLESPGDLARTILALEGAEVDPHSFGGRDLVSALVKRRRDNGSFEGWPGSTAFAVIALRAAGATGGLDRSISWLAKVQEGDGGWGDVPDSPSTADGTGAVMQAMPGAEAAKHGLGYLRNTQRPNGGFALGGGGPVNSQSTAWAVQGMLAVGADPGSAKGGESALDYLEARQDADGHYRYSSSSDQTPVWVTAEVLSATAGQPFPVTPVARQVPPSQSSSGSVPTTPAPPASTVPPAATGSPSELLESLGQSPGAVSPPGVGSPPAISPAAPGGPAPVTPPGGSLKGLVPETSAAVPPPAAPPFEAGDNPGPKPWAPIGIGLGAAAAALAGVLLLGRRFAW